MPPANCHKENEKSLARRLKAGDTTAFDEIYHLYFTPVYNNAVRITRDAAAAEDVLQEVFITLWEKRAGIDPEKSLAGWLFVLSYNFSITILRRRLKESKLHRQLPQNSDNAAEEEMKFGIQWKILKSAMDHLSTQQRRVFELCKLQGKTYEEAATELHISKYTVKEYLSAALVSIKKYTVHHPETYLIIGPFFLLS